MPASVPPPSRRRSAPSACRPRGRRPWWCPEGAAAGVRPAHPGGRRLGGHGDHPGHGDGRQPQGPHWAGTIGQLGALQDGGPQVQDPAVTSRGGLQRQAGPHRARKQVLARSCPAIHPGGQDHRLGTRHCLLHRPPRGHAAGAQREQRLGHPAACRPGPRSRTRSTPDPHRLRAPVGGRADGPAHPAAPAALRTRRPHVQPRSAPRPVPARPTPRPPAPPPAPAAARPGLGSPPGAPNWVPTTSSNPGPTPRRASIARMPRITSTPLSPRASQPPRQPGRNTAVVADHGDIHAEGTQRCNAAARSCHQPAPVRRGSPPGKGQSRESPAGKNATGGHDARWRSGQWGQPGDRRQASCPAAR